MSHLIAATPRRLVSAISSRQRTTHIEAFGLSHRGLVRRHNEDDFIVAPDIGLFAVADGMGGEAAGEVASRMTVAAVGEMVENPELCWSGVEPGLPLLLSGVELANTCVYAEASRDTAKAGMGTTFTGLLVLEDRIALAHVGDSRAYLLRTRGLEQLTIDHTLVHECIQAGRMTREEAAVSPFRHIISRAVGTNPSVAIDGRVIPTAPGDTVLLASDGLHGVLSDGEIETILRRESDVTRAAMHLIERANDLGGPDNVTVVLVRFVGTGRKLER